LRLQRHGKGHAVSQISRDRVRRAIEGRFNPIRGLKPSKLARVLDQYHSGYLREAALLWDAMENRDLLIRNVASKRKKAVARAQWEILTTDDSAEAMQQKEALEVFYNNLVATSVMNENERGGMGLLVRQMMDAIGKGFAVHEIVWRPIEGKGFDRRQARRASPIQMGTAARGAALPARGTDNPASQNFITADFRFVPLWFFENTTGAAIPGERRGPWASR
jgi:phage gp29-like protein